MTEIAIRVESLAKQYQIGKRIDPHATLRDQLGDTLDRPVRWLRRNGHSPSSTKDPDFIWALQDVSFEIKRGKVVGIIGRNGAGKSTLLKILSRITEPTHGYADIFGRIGSLLEVGTGFHPELTGRENIYLNGAILGMKRAEIQRKFDEIVSFAEVEQFIDTPVKRYSSGMYVRLAFAVAAHLEPDILLVDEVLAVGDAAFQKKCLGRMGDVAKEGRTVLFVSHNMGVISSLCDQTIHFSLGRVQAIGPTSQVVAAYLGDLVESQADSLDRLRWRGLGKVARFNSIKLISGDGRNILFGEPIRVALTVWSENDLSNLTIGSSIYNSSGTCVGNTITKDDFAVVGNHEVALTWSLSNSHLAPGYYYTGFSIGRGGYDGHRNDYDIVIGTPAFQVLPIGDGAERIAHWERNWGSVVFDNADLQVAS